ncbi:MAG: hypothetical protein P8X74_22140 [Reinekea sp.]
MLPKNWGEPMGAPAIFEKQIEIRLLHPASTEGVTDSGMDLLETGIIHILGAPALFTDKSARPEISPEAIILNPLWSHGFRDYSSQIRRINIYMPANLIRLPRIMLMQRYQSFMQLAAFRRLDNHHIAMLACPA